MTDINNLSLEEAYFAHAPTPAEVGAYLDALILVMSENASAVRFDRYSTNIIIDHHPATFTLNIGVEANNNEFCGLNGHAREMFQHKHDVCDTHRFETVPGFVFSTNSHGAHMRHLPCTKEMLGVVQHRLAKTGWSVFLHLAEQVRRITPIDKFYITRKGAMEAAGYHMEDCPYPRHLAPLGDHLTARETDTLASDVPLYALRELRRIEDNTYVSLPDEISRMIPDSVYLKEVPHLAVKGTNIGKVAYTENARKGVADVQSVMKPGKYLRRVLKKQITNDQHLKEMVAALRASASFDVKITTDPDEAREVYLTGPDSCMAHGESRFDETFDLNNEWRHPIEALFWPDGSGNIGLVYVESQGRPAARALINLDKKGYPALYAADWAPAARNALEEWFEENGYSQDEDTLYGCSIPRIDLRNRAILCPYIDSNNLGVTVIDDDELEIGGDLQADYQQGYVREEDDRPMCDDCEERVDDDEIQYLPHPGHHVCDECLGNSYVMALDDDGDLEYIHDCNANDIGFLHRHPGTGQLFEYVVEDISQSTLNDAGLCETLHDEIYPIDDCYRVEDTGDWVHGDNVAAYTCPPDKLFVDYIQLDEGTVHEAGDCVWLTDASMWIHEDDVNFDTHMTHEEGLHTIAELLDEEAA